MSLKMSLGPIALGVLLFSHVTANAEVFAVKALKTVSGIIDGSNGNIVAGKGFTAVRNGVGDYTLSFPAGSFKKVPAFSCSGAGANGGAPICIIFGLGFHTTAPTTVNIRMENPSSQLQDNAFHFTEITTR